MGAYNKNIAVIKGIKSGFSADGGQLTGIVKAEKYGGFLRAEASLINFAPLTEGRYVVGITDGEHTEVFDRSTECMSELEISHGFAAVVFFVNGEVLPIAAAVCGDMQWATAGITREVERREKLGSAAVNAYEDDAIAEENYYEYDKDFKERGALRADTQQKEGCGICKNEVNRGICAAQRGGAAADGEDMNGDKNIFGADFLNAFNTSNGANGGFNEGVASGFNGADFNSAGGNGGNGANKGEEKARENIQNQDKAREIPLADDLKFYEKMRGEIERLLSEYPREEELERIIENSRWARISYGGERYYVFGVLYSGGKPSYICYGVPSRDAGKPPESLKGMAGYIPAGKSGYWVMYQDARTGAGIRLDAT